MAQRIHFQSKYAAVDAITRLLESARARRDESWHTFSKANYDDQQEALEIWKRDCGIVDGLEQAFTEVMNLDYCEDDLQ